MIKGPGIARNRAHVAWDSLALESAGGGRQARERPERRNCPDVSGSLRATQPLNYQAKCPSKPARAQVHQRHRPQAIEQQNLFSLKLGSCKAQGHRAAFRTADNLRPRLQRVDSFEAGPGVTGAGNGEEGKFCAWDVAICTERVRIAKPTLHKQQPAARRQQSDRSSAFASQHHPSTRALGPLRTEVDVSDPRWAPATTMLAERWPPTGT